MRQPLVAGNWKMHGSRAENARLVRRLLDRLQPEPRLRGRGLPAVRLPAGDRAPAATAAAAARGAGRLRGGGRAPSRAKSPRRCCATWAAATCIVGHSERRALYRRDRRAGGAQVRGGPGARAWCRSSASARRSTSARRARRSEVVAPPARCRARRVGRGARRSRRAVVAYEPVWAIGTGRTATPSRPRKCTRSSAATVAARDATIARPAADPVRRQRQGANAGSCSRCPISTAGSIGGASLKADEFRAHLRGRGLNGAR